MIDVLRADDTDVELLRPLWNALRAHHHDVAPEFGPLRPEPEGWERRARDYREILAEGGALFVARDGDALVGMAICEAEEGHSATWPYPRQFLSVVDLVLLPQARGQQVGERLMAAVEAEARARGYEAVDLMVAGPNDGARRFYERLGFTPDLVTYRKRVS
jgi:ribosomal protein S18 acetylase RimI-like enzyme